MSEEDRLRRAEERMEAIGEEVVRHDLAMGKYIAGSADIARVWLAKIDRDRENAHRAALEREAGDSNRIAKEANRIAKQSVGVAVGAFLVSALAFLKAFGII